MTREILTRVVIAFCGVVLLSAVAFKVYGSTVGGDQPLSMFSPAVQLVGLEAEALIGLWLLSGFARRTGWMCGLGLFALLGAVSVYLIATGQPSCGCFGRIQVSPWASLSLDLICFVGLLAVRPRHQPSVRTLSMKTVLTCCGVAVIVIGVFAVLVSEPGSRMVARLRGEVLVVRGGDAELGTGSPGSTRAVAIKVQNISDQPVRLVGGTATCACVATADLPLTIPVGQSADVNVSVRFTGESGRFKHTLFWYTDSPAQPRLTAAVIGVVGVE